MKLKGAQIIAEVLLENGVDTVFGYPGGAVLNIYDALYDYSDRIRHIMTAHEQGAAHAADGYARSTGRTGVVMATSGPGATNLVTGIATAYMDSIPVVAITGNVATSLIGRDSFQEVYIAGITMPITKHNFVVRDANELADILRQAFFIAESDRPGPVLVDVPKDITAAFGEYVRKEKRAPHKDAEKHELSEAASLINAAKRPLVCYGGGVRIADASDALRSLLKKADIPAVHTVMAAGVLCSAERENLGLIGMHGSLTANRALDAADLLLVLGARFSDRVVLQTQNFAKNAKIIQVDIDESEIGKNVAVDMDIVGDAGEVLKQLLPLVHEARHEEWQEQISEWRRSGYVPKDDPSVLKPHSVLRAVSRLAGEDAIYVTDVGQHQMWAVQYLNHVSGRRFLTSGGLGTMGYGYGAAIGARIGNPDRPVVHITSDGSLHMNMAEACTAVSYGLPIVTVILDNAVLGMVRQWQDVFYGRRFASSEPERATDYVKVAEGFGAKGYRCTDLAGFERVFAEALRQNVPSWIHCPIDREERVCPMIPSGKTVDDAMFD